MCKNPGKIRKRANKAPCAFALQERSHLGVSQGFAGDVALHLRLVDGVDRRPHDAAAEHDGPEGVALQGVRVEADER